MAEENQVEQTTETKEVSIVIKFRVIRGDEGKIETLK